MEYDFQRGVNEGEINIHGKSRDPKARLLSALTNRPFQFGGIMISSIEGWYQGIKFPPEDPRHFRAFASCYGYAKQFSHQAEEEYIWWEGESHKYGSERHIQLIEECFRASYNQNPDLTEALIQTNGLRLKHDTEDGNKSGTPFPTTAFCELLTKIRSELLRERGIEEIIKP